MAQATGNAAGSVDPVVSEVIYNEGATPLFLAIEETEWRHALQIAQDEPEQISTWVVSTGTVETTFHWNLWRRLPLHEACRRQAPAWFISCLLSVYPSSARQRTQFGELPLHLAVECGSPPEVVNLLIVAYWPAIAATDQSGRTPVSICQDSEMMDMEEHKVVHESLSRSMETYQQLMARHEADIEALKKTHAAGLQAIRKQHDDDLQVEQDQHEKLLAEVKRLKDIIKDKEGTSLQKSRRIDEADASNQALQRQIIGLKDERKQEQSKLQSQDRRSQALEKIVKERDVKIATLNKQIAQLKTDLQQIGQWQDHELRAKINQSEEAVQIMVEHFCGLTESLSSRSESFRKMLADRGIPSLGGPRRTRPAAAAIHTAKDEKKDIDQEDDINDEDALTMAAVAASAAIGIE